MTVPDPNRIGGLEWARRPRGKLTAAERRRLLGAIAASQAVNVFGRVKLALGRLPEGASSIDVRDFQPPDSRLPRAAEGGGGGGPGFPWRPPPRPRSGGPAPRG